MKGQVQVARSTETSTNYDCVSLILQNEGCTVGKRSSKAKKAPDFSKIHKKWESQLSKVNIT